MSIKIVWVPETAINYNTVTNHFINNKEVESITKEDNEVYNVWFSCVSKPTDDGVTSCSSFIT